MGARKYAEAWAERGHDVRVLTGGGRDLPGREVVRGVEVVRVGTVRKKDRATASMAFMSSYLISGGLFILRNRARLRSFDIINTHFSIPTGPLGWFASRVLRLPNVLTIIGGDIYDPSKGTSPHRFFVLRAANRFLTRTADRVIAISSDTAARARDLHRITVPIRVINYGFEPGEHDPDSTGPDPTRGRGADPAGRFNLIAVGRLVERKGFDHLIRALEILPDDVRLTIVGDGPLGPELQGEAKRLGVEERLRLTGFLPNSEVDRELRAADCFVLSSLHEGLGIVVQEAMYAGLPVVSTDEGGQVDLLTEGRNALLVPPGDPVALARAIQRIRDDPALTDQMARHNQEDLKPLYMEKNAGHYLEIFRELVGRDRPGPGVEAPATQPSRGLSRP